MCWAFRTSEFINLPTKDLDDPSAQLVGPVGDCGGEVKEPGPLRLGIPELIESFGEAAANTFAGGLQHLVLVHQGLVFGLKEQHSRMAGFVARELLQLAPDLISDSRGQRVIIGCGPPQEYPRLPIAALRCCQAERCGCQVELVNAVRESVRAGRL